MDLRIGQTGETVMPSRAMGFNRPRREEESGTSERGAVDVFHSREEREVVRVGFGKGTISPAGAALTTVDRNLEEARRVVPTVDELREEEAARRAELRAEQNQEPEREPQAFRPEPAPQARRFVEQNEEAGPPAFPPRAAPEAPAPQATEAAARFDVLV